MSIIRRLKLCNLSSLFRMSKTLSDEINKLRKKSVTKKLNNSLKTNSNPEYMMNNSPVIVI